MGRRQLSSVQLLRLRRQLEARLYHPTVSLDPGLLLDLVDELLGLRELEFRHRVALAVDAEADAAAMARDEAETPVRPLHRIVVDMGALPRSPTRRVDRSGWLRACEQDADGGEPGD